MSRPFSLAALIVAAGGIASPALALSTRACSARYQAAKQAGSLKGQTWNDFRKAECGAAADAAVNTVPNPIAPPATAPVPASRSAPASARGSPASAVYPRAIDPKYATESAGKARMHTCLDSYNAAKAAGTLGDAKWIQKGGGYYSVCNKRLKG